MDGAAQSGGPSGSLGNSGNSSGNNSGNSGRVRLMLTPKPEAAASAPADPGRLRPSSTLEGKTPEGKTPEGKSK